MHDVLVMCPYQKVDGEVLVLDHVIPKFENVFFYQMMCDVLSSVSLSSVGHRVLVVECGKNRSVPRTKRASGVECVNTSSHN